MKNKEAGNKKEKSIDIVKTKKEATFLIITGLVFFVGFLLFFIFFYRPFVPWKKIVCSKEDGTYIYNESIQEVQYFYEIDGIAYSKSFSRRTASNQSWPFEDVPYTIYVNLNNPTDVKPGNRGGGFFIFVNWMFIVMGGYMTGLSIYKFHLIKISKEKLK